MSRLRCRLIVIAVLLVAPSAAAQELARFDTFLRDYGRADEGHRSTLIATFITEQGSRGGFPIRDASGDAVFVYVAPPTVREVRLVGDFHTQSDTNPYWASAGEPLTKIGALFHRRRTFEPDARLDYRFVVDGDPTPDPLNPRTILSGAGNGQASELVMPAYQVRAETTSQPTVPHGTLHVVQESWATPSVTVYLPPHYDSTQAYPTLYTADGTAWRSLIGLPATLDNLIAAKRIEPIIAVMIDPAANRSTWYHCNADYPAYLKRVVSYVDRHYATRSRASARVHVGTSSGAKAAVQVAIALADTFGGVGVLSPSLTPMPTCLEPYLTGRTPLPSPSQPCIRDTALVRGGTRWSTCSSTSLAGRADELERRTNDRRDATADGGRLAPISRSRMKARSIQSGTARDVQSARTADAGRIDPAVAESTAPAYSPDR